MKRILTIVCLLECAILSIILDSTQASAVTPISNDTCKSSAGNLYNQISSVKWMCDGATNDVNNRCSIWIAGENKEFAPSLLVNNVGTENNPTNVKVYFAGSCTLGPACATKVYVKNGDGIGFDHYDETHYKSFVRGSITGTNRYNNKTADKVGYSEISLNAYKFIQGVTPTNVTVDGKSYKKYTREVTMQRCHTTDGTCNEGSNNSCGGQSESISVLVLDELTLSLKSVDVNGNSLSGISGLEDKSVKSNYDAFASLTRGDATGYTFIGFKQQDPSTSGWNGKTVLPAGSILSCGTDDRPTNSSEACVTSNSYVRKMTADYTVYAVYERNSFKGQASVAAGSNWSGTSNREATGWVADDKSVSINVDCENSGCNTNYWLQLKTVGGSGSTNYWIGKSIDGGNIAWWPSSSVSQPITPEVSPDYSLLLGTSGNVGEIVSLNPGQSYCRYLSFYPYGSLANSTYKTASACANAKVTEFEGKSTITGAGSGSVGWQGGKDESKTVEIPNCDPVNGCKVSFKHELRIPEGSSGKNGTTNYTVKRTSNLTDSNSDRRIADNPNVASGTFSKSSNQTVSTSGEWTLYPGMVVCETLTFKPSNNAVNPASDITLKICASATGNPTPPPDPNPSVGNTSYLDIKVRNNDGADKYKDYQLKVYAKPNDKISYRTTYNPLLQYTYYIIPEGMTIDGGGLRANDSGKILGSFYNDYKPSGKRNWNNAFGLTSRNLSSNINKSYKYDLGDKIGKIVVDPKDYTVLPENVGKALEVDAKLNIHSDDMTTPTQVSFSLSGGKNIVNIQTNGDVGNTATAYVPYNFINSTEVTTDSDTLLYAGEKANIEYNITTEQKENKETNGTYATIVKDAKWKIELYYDGVWHSSTEGTGNLNEEYDLSGKTVSRNSSVVIPDVDAGTTICMRSAVYPANSGADTNMDPRGSDTWANSAEVCFKVAKKPSIQIWGGSLYSAGTLNVPYAAKLHVYGFNENEPYDINRTAGYRVFGSWTELGLVSMGENTGFGSGASMGYSLNTGEGILSPSYNSENANGTDPGGSKEVNASFCLRSILTFANTSNNASLACDTSTAGLGASGSDVASSNKLSLIARFVNMTDEERSAKKVRYSEHNDGYTIDATTEDTTVSGGYTRVIRSGKTVKIDADIIYDNGDNGYSTLEDVPKMIIFANNIEINCHVNRIDAVLISENDINTCADSEDINSVNNSNQLIINGSIITNTLTANRTYGAAKGSNSAIPAEIINYDATLYLWGANKADVTESGRLSETYMRELSPRY